MLLLGLRPWLPLPRCLNWTSRRDLAMSAGPSRCLTPSDPGGSGYTLERARCVCVRVEVGGCPVVCREGVGGDVRGEKGQRRLPGTCSVLVFCSYRSLNKGIRGWQSVLGEDIQVIVGCRGLSRAAFGVRRPTLPFDYSSSSESREPRKLAGAFANTSTKGLACARSPRLNPRRACDISARIYTFSLVLTFPFRALCLQLTLQ